MAIIQLTKADFEKRESFKPAAPKLKVEQQTVTLDELDDILWSQEGFTQASYLHKHIAGLIETYGPFAKLSIEPFESTVVNYIAVLDKDGVEQISARGKHPRFQEGWVCAGNHGTLESTGIDFSVRQMRVEGRFWVEGFIACSREELESIADDQSPERTIPYLLGALAAWDEYFEPSSEPVILPPEGDRRLSSGIYRDGYHEMADAIQKLWPDTLDSTDIF